ncbi:MAG: metalloregulator ArsR/SmtB family transcription factor [Opitutales bacterium]|nr:metalloregulator ArsR/SmtB family transcription factor [Opitutales bacterium]
MALDKSNLFPSHTIALAEFAEGLGHPARISIVTELMKHPDGLCCGELVERMPLAQATVSQHLKVLQRIDLLEATSQHTRMIYRLRQDRLRNFCRAFQQTLGTHDCENGTQSGGMDAAGMLMP